MPPRAVHKETSFGPWYWVLWTWVTLPAGLGIQRVILASGKATFPGSARDAAPIGSNHDADGVRARRVVYVPNGSVDGFAQQPYRFEVGRAMVLATAKAGRCAPRA